MNRFQPQFKYEQQLQLQPATSQLPPPQKGQLPPPESQTKEDSPPKQPKPDETTTPTRKESEERDAEREKGKTDPEIIRDLKVELK